MLRIINLTNKPMDITPNIQINSHSYLDVQTTITPRLYHLMNMGAIKIQEINETTQTKNKEFVSEGSLRRKRMMEKIRNGNIKPSTSLDVSLYNQFDNTNKFTKPKTKKGK